MSIIEDDQVALLKEELAQAIEAERKAGLAVQQAATQLAVATAICWVGVKVGRDTWLLPMSYFANATSDPGNTTVRVERLQEAATHLIVERGRDSVKVLVYPKATNPSWFRVPWAGSSQGQRMSNTNRAAVEQWLKR